MTNPLPVTWTPGRCVVLRRESPPAFGPFELKEEAVAFAKLYGGIVVEWREPLYVCDGCPPAYGAIWFDGDWDRPDVVGPFYDIAEAERYAKGIGFGSAVELDEFPDEYEDGTPP